MLFPQTRPRVCCNLEYFVALSIYSTAVVPENIKIRCDKNKHANETYEKFVFAVVTISVNFETIRVALRLSVDDLQI